MVLRKATRTIRLNPGRFRIFVFLGWTFIFRGKFRKNHKEHFRQNFQRNEGLFYTWPHVVWIWSSFNHLRLPLNLIDHLIIGPIKPTLNEMGFFWRLSYYDDVFFRHCSCIPIKKPYQTRAKKYFWNSDQIKILGSISITIPIVLTQPGPK